MAALYDPDTANAWTLILVTNGADLGLTDDAGNLVSWDHFITAVIYDPAEL